MLGGATMLSLIFVAWGLWNYWQPTNVPDIFTFFVLLFVFKFILVCLCHNTCFTSLPVVWPVAAAVSLTSHTCREIFPDPHTTKHARSEINWTLLDKQVCQYNSRLKAKHIMVHCPSYLSTSWKQIQTYCFLTRGEERWPGEEEGGDMLWHTFLPRSAGTCSRSHKLMRCKHNNNTHTLHASSIYDTYL